MCFRTGIELTFVKTMCLIFPDSSFTRLNARLNGETSSFNSAIGHVSCLAARSENLNANYVMVGYLFEFELVNRYKQRVPLLLLIVFFFHTIVCRGRSAAVFD